MQTSKNASRAKLHRLAGFSHGFNFLTEPYGFIERVCNFYSVAVSKAVSDNASSISSSQLTLLNHLGTLPSIARNWDARTVQAELRNVDAASFAELELSRSEPTAVQRVLAKRHGVVLPVGASRLAAAATLATVQPPSIRSLAVLYGVLEYDGDVPASDAAARQLVRRLALERPHSHPLDTDLSPVARSQINELFNRLGYIGRLPYSYGSAQLMAVCLRTILADVDDEARLRPLPGLDPRQADLIRYLRSRRAPPGHTRGMPAVLDLDLPSHPAVSRLAAARNILQLLQNHELCASPTGTTAEALQKLGHVGPIPPTTGETLMLVSELRDRCLRPKSAHIAALRAATALSGAAAGSAATNAVLAAAAEPDSVAHFKAMLRVLRRADTDAATPATRTAQQHLAELRRRTPASSHAAAAAIAPWSGGSAAAAAAAVGPCPSQLEVRAAIEDLPLSETMMERLFDLGWQGPMPATHGSALALEEYLLHHKNTANTSPSANASPGPSRNPHADTPTVAAVLTASGAGSQLRRPGQYTAQHHDDTYDRRIRLPYHISRLGSTPEEALTKIQIRGMFPGAVSEWYLPTMSHEEAKHVLSCLMAMRRVVLERVSGGSYDEYVDRWSEAEAEGDWW
ncbi:hypothetical protein Vretifemale_11458, partial [Volvox reticuliferus]